MTNSLLRECMEWMEGANDALESEFGGSGEAKPLELLNRVRATLAGERSPDAKPYVPLRQASPMTPEWVTAFPKSAAYIINELAARLDAFRAGERSTPAESPAAFWSNKLGTKGNPTAHDLVMMLRNPESPADLVVSARFAADTLERMGATPPSAQATRFQLVERRCGLCGYRGVETDHIGQCPSCHWDELVPVCNEVSES